MLGVGCSGSDVGAYGTGSIQEPLKPITIEPRRSLVATEQTILSRFSLQRVMSQLAAQSGVTGLTGLSLFQQWWDTQNAGPTTIPGPHCNDQTDTTLGSTINGYPYLCRDGAEGAQAACDPFAEGSSCAYVPIGLFNRFDKAREDGGHCGEYRIVYAKSSGVSSTSDRNLLIFEATLPNPHPQQGVKGCQQIVDTWADLSSTASANARAAVLEQFYFVGMGSIPPVVSIANFGDNALGSGQIRTNQFSNTTTGWSLREFKLMRTCTNEGPGSSGNAGGGNAGGAANAGGAGGSGNTGLTCTAMQFIPVTNKTNPYGPLFSPNGPTYLAQGTAFQNYFPSQVPSLAGSTIGSLDMAIPDIYNTAQSQASGTTAAEMKYDIQIGTDSSSLSTAIEAQAGGLSATDIMRRAMTQTCAGCHKLVAGQNVGGTMVWPASLGFTHVTERETETVDGEVRFKISPALIDNFLPARQQILEDFLNNRPRPTRGPNHPLSASSSHG